MSRPGPEFSILLEPWRAVYIDIAKVASSSLKAIFAALLALDLDAVDGNPHELRFPVAPSFNSQGDRLYPDYYSFGFVRNPWDRIVSVYRDKIRGETVGFTRFSASGIAHCLDRFDAFKANMSFVDFVYAVSSIPDNMADEHFRSQIDYLTSTSGEIAVDFVGRYENLAFDFRQVAEAIGLPANISLPRLQTARRVIHYEEFYTSETRDIVARRFAHDIDRFSYQFG